MIDQTVREDKVSTPKVWLTFVGGGVAWFAHLASAYLIAEFGCGSEFQYVKFMGVTAVAWLLFLVSALTAALAGWSAIVAQRHRRRLHEYDPKSATEEGSEFYLSTAGLFLNLWFIFIIFVQMIPIFYYLHQC